METRLQLVPDRHDDTDELVTTAGLMDPVGLGGTAGGGSADGVDGSAEHSEVASADCDDAGLRIPFVVPLDRWRGRARGESRGELRGGSRGGPRDVRSGGRWARLVHDERGAVTAEYAIVIMAAVAFAGLLVAILRSAEIRAMLVQLVEDALGAAG